MCIQESFFPERGRNRRAANEEYPTGQSHIIGDFIDLDLMQPFKCHEAIAGIRKNSTTGRCKDENLGAVHFSLVQAITQFTKNSRFITLIFLASRMIRAIRSSFRYLILLMIMCVPFYHSTDFPYFSCLATTSFNTFCASVSFSYLDLILATLPDRIALSRSPSSSATSILR